MNKNYKVVFVYPDGHIEEIDQIFTVGRDALEYGNSLLTQVINTEGMRSNKAYRGEDIFSRKDPIQPYFMIIEINKRKYNLVYDSRSK